MYVSCVSLCQSSIKMKMCDHQYRALFKIKYVLEIMPVHFSGGCRRSSAPLPKPLKQTFAGSVSASCAEQTCWEVVAYDVASVWTVWVRSPITLATKKISAPLGVIINVTVCLVAVLKTLMGSSIYELLNFNLWMKSTSFNVWVRYFVWNFKGTLWNSTQNILPIHWKIRFLYNIEILRALRFKS